jgi:hypothetical protein
MRSQSCLRQAWEKRLYKPERYLYLLPMNDAGKQEMAISERRLHGKERLGGLRAYLPEFDMAALTGA